MSEAAGSAKEAAERNAAAVAKGDLNQVMADITPEALTQMMQLGAQQGAQGMTPGTMPNITDYAVRAKGTTEDGGEVFEVTFRSEAGSATLAATWKVVLGQWKITNIEIVEVQRAGSE